MLTQNNQTDPNIKKEEKGEEQSEPITTPEEVPESNDEKIDQDFPGYPHYPANDDMLNPGNGTQRVDVDIENLSTGNLNKDINLNKNLTGEAGERQNVLVNEPEPGNDDSDLQIVEGTEADVTDEDLIILEGIDGNYSQALDHGNEDGLSILNVDELDVPGAELDNANESLGEEDEENNYYSIGGDNHESIAGR